LPNGLSIFTPDGTIDSETNITVTAVTKSSGGSIAESIESIKFNAPRAFTTQERAVTTTDFENLLKQKYPEINAVSAYGGEELDPPQFGKVFVALDLKETDILSRSKQDEYYTFLNPRSIVSIDPVFVDPDYVYVDITTSVKYNINISPINSDDIRALVLMSINKYATSNLDNFNKTLRYSKLVKAIDDSSSGIISNETDVIGLKILKPVLNTNTNYRLNYGYEFKTGITNVSGEQSALERFVISSTLFTVNNQKVYLEDDGAGIINLVAATGLTTQSILGQAGTVDYKNGIIYLNRFNVSDYEGSAIKIYAKPVSKDIQSTKDIILNVLDEDIKISVTAVRE